MSGVADRRPVLLVTSHAPADRIAPFTALHERLLADGGGGLHVALFGGRSRHGSVGEASPEAVPHVAIAQSEVRALAASGRFRAVVCGTGGRVALPGAYRGACSAGVPFVLWASLWAHPRSAAHALSLLPTRWLYRHADAVVTYGEHVSAYVRRHGARRVFEAPQAVDASFWAAPVAASDVRREHAFQVLFVGRDDPEKGAAIARAAWPETVMVSGVTPVEVRNFLAGSSVLVMASLRTRTFREPWGLVANEAMLRSLPVIASTEVGAAAGGLVRHERNGLVVEAGDVTALRGAIERLRDDEALRIRLGENAARDVAAFTPEAWATGVRAGLTAADHYRRGRS